MPRILSPAQCACTVIAVSLCLTGLAAAQDGIVAGRRIVDVIAELRQQGLVVIYSSELLAEELRVRTEPTARDPFARLDEILAPYGLTLEPGPRDSWLVVRAEAEAETDAAVEPAAQRAMRPTPTVAPPGLEEVVVSASRYSISRNSASTAALIDRVQLENTPTLGEDALRVTHSLPGLTSSGLTAQVNVRGGTTNEGLLFLDGVRLFDPFHLKDFQSLFSSINPGIVDSMTVYTGAFPAPFGDRMSAVIDMTSIDPQGPPSLEIGLSLLTTSLLASGSFDEDRGAWLTNVRRGNLDILIEAANPDLGSPEYQDIFNKFRYDLDSRWTLTLGMLYLRDELTLNEGDFASARADYDDSYLWARTDYESEKLDVSFLLSTTKLDSFRSGELDDPATSTGTLLDERQFRSTAVKVDGSYLIDDRNLLSWGAELRDSSADYRYASSLSASLPIAIPAPLIAAAPDFSAAPTVDARQTAVYASLRTRPIDALTADLGLRWDDQNYLDDHQLSPRLNLRFDVNDRLRLRASWGKYFQTQRPDELQINNGITSFLPAQESEHYVLGVEYLLGDGTAIRLETYRKEIESLQPRSENLFARVSLLPELQPDRVTLAPNGGESSGVELSADGERGPWRWWASLTNARTYDLFDEGRSARSWEEPWSLKGGAIRTGRVWNLALTTTWHSGWPISTLALEGGALVASDYNGRRFGEFGSVDVRISRAAALEHSELEWYVSLLNIFGRDNACCIEYDVGFDALGQPAELSLGTGNWLSAVANIGILWRFARREP